MYRRLKLLPSRLAMASNKFHDDSFTGRKSRTGARKIKASVPTNARASAPPSDSLRLGSCCSPPALAFFLFFGTTLSSTVMLDMDGRPSSSPRTAFTTLFSTGPTRGSQDGRPRESSQGARSGRVGLPSLVNHLSLSPFRALLSQALITMSAAAWRTHFT